MEGFTFNTVFVVGVVVARYIIVVVALASAISLLAQQISSISFRRS